MAQRQLVVASTLTGAKVLTEQEVTQSGVLVMDPGGAARTVDLPETSHILMGHSVKIVNTGEGAEVLTVRLTSAGATVGLIPPGAYGEFLCYSTTAGSWVCTSSTMDVLVNSADQGAVPFVGAAGWEILAPGSDTEQLTSGGADADVSWTAQAPA